MNRRKKSRVYLVLAGVVIVSLFVVLGCVLELKSEAASSSGTVNFVIEASPYTESNISYQAQEWIKYMNFTYSTSSGESSYLGWSSSAGSTLTAYADDPDDVVFTICNWTDYTVYYDFIDNSTGKIVYTLKAVVTVYNEFEFTSVTAGVFTEGKTYTVVPAARPGCFPFRPRAGATVTFNVELPDGRIITRLVASCSETGLPVYIASRMTPGEFREFFSTAQLLPWSSFVYEGKAYEIEWPSDDFFYVIADATQSNLTFTFKAYDVEAERIVHVTYLDAYGKELYVKSFTARVVTSSFTVPSYRGMTCLPKVVDLGEGYEGQECSVSVYCVDVSSEVESSYSDGYAAGLKDGADVSYSSGYDAGLADGYASGYAPGFDAGVIAGQQQASQAYDQAYKEGYDVGYDKGLHQNALTGAQISEIRKDYNVITGFFDGMWNWMRDFFTTVTEGVGFGGVTVGDVIWTMVIIAVVLWIGGKVL